MSRASELRRSRPRSRFLRASFALLVGLGAWAWFGGTVDGGRLFTAERADNLMRFLTVEALPSEVREASGCGARLEAGAAWIGERVTGRNLDAALATLGAALVAAVLAAALGLFLAPWVARSRTRAGSTVARASPWSSAAGRLGRGLCVLMRSVPEYILAFLLGAALPSAAWAAVLALTVHNAGILGRLFGETVENLDPRPADAWSAAGAPRASVFLAAELPEALPRMLTYFFTRFESCVRESTVLGMLGFVSLGHYIVLERAAGRYDEMLMLVALGSTIVLAADFVSWIARTIVRRAA